MTDYVPVEGRAGLFQKIRQQQVILVASACVIALTIALKNILMVPAEILTRDIAIYSILYLGFLVFAFRPGGNYERSGTVSPLAWDVLVVIITLTILLVYAL